MWKKTIAMILALGLLTAYSFCLTSCKDNQEISDNQSGNDSENKTALSEATDFFNKYYDDLNAKKVDSIKSYYSMDDEKVQELCDNLNFMFMLYDIKYVLDDIQAEYVESGISATIQLISESTSLDNQKKTRIKETYNYLLVSGETGYTISAYSVGNSQVLDLDSAE